VKDKTPNHKRVKYLTAAEVKAVLNVPSTNTPKGIRDRAIMMLMVWHGLQVIEVHRLNLEDIDLEEGSLRAHGKRDEWRTVFLVDKTREALRKWLAIRDMMRSPRKALFLNLHWGNARYRGRRISPRGIRAMVDRYLDLVGAKRPGVSCHALRHSHALLSLAGGAPIEALSDSLGHANLTTTKRYEKILDRARANPAKLLEQVLGTEG
jgi:site-specific recombinase XerD